MYVLPRFEVEVSFARGRESELRVGNIGNAGQLTGVTAGRTMKPWIQALPIHRDGADELS